MSAFPKTQELCKGKVYKKGKLTVLKKTCIVKKQFRLFHFFNILEKIRSNTTLVAVRRTTLEKFFQSHLYKPSF